MALLNDTGLPTLRGHVTAAPLKLKDKESPCGTAACPPRSRDRGPIEAIAGPPPPSTSPASLRGHVTAAPLKQRRRIAGERELDAALRGHVTAAPLKPDDLARLLELRAAPPRSRDRGPIEA